jgi:AcrR family transcriptional regulator
MPGDAQETRQRLIEAASQEFAARGIAGARVDRIAALAGCNKALIYFHFGSKDGLFDAVFDQVVVRTVREVPIDPQDLPGYAGRLYDGYRLHPETVQLATWYRLERSGDRPPLEAIVAANTDKIAAIEAAQGEGRLPRHFRAPELLALVLTISTMWATSAPEFSGDVGDPERQRRTITEAVEALIAVP